MYADIDQLDEFLFCLDTLCDQIGVGQRCEFSKTFQQRLTDGVLMDVPYQLHV